MRFHKHVIYGTLLTSTFLVSKVCLADSPGNINSICLNFKQIAFQLEKAINTDRLSSRYAPTEEAVNFTNMATCPATLAIPRLPVSNQANAPLPPLPPVLLPHQK